MAVNLEKLSPLELEELIAAAAEQKKKLQKQRLTEVRNKLTAMAREEGYSIEELFGSAGRSKGGRTVAPKYRHPADPAQTWSGRGKRPRWVQAHLDAGNTLESLAI
jgi:DNA-binding protein H-NS